jgi:AraC-like DNA-binding protein
MMNTTLPARAITHPRSGSGFSFFRVNPAGRPERIFPDQRVTLQEHDLKSKVEAFIRNERPFLRPGFTLTDMAVETGIPRHVLSHFINRAYGMNFNSLINEFRVSYLKSIPGLDPEWRRLTLEALGRMAGFNSRNTLIKAFKKCTGECPSDYFSRAGDMPMMGFANAMMDGIRTN